MSNPQDSEDKPLSMLYTYVRKRSCITRAAIHPENGRDYIRLGSDGKIGRI